MQKSFAKIMGTGAVLSFLATATGQILVNDTFDVGSPPNVNGSGDPMAVSWSSPGSLSLVNDNVSGGINSGNAMQLPASGFFSTFGSGGAFTSQTLAVGNSIQLTFTLRYAGAPANNNAGLRFGLGSAGGTYFATLGTGGTAGYGTDRGVGLSLSGAALLGSGAMPSINDTLPHNVSFILSRTATAINLSGSLDGNPFSGSDPASSYTVFDSIALGEGSSSSGYRVDNVMVTIPEPGTFSLIGISIFALAARRSFKRSGVE